MRNFKSAIPMAIVLIFCCWASSVVNAASQGQWGRTSTATAKITLRIHPKPDQQSQFGYAEYQSGFEALNHYCQALQQGETGNGNTPYFQFSLTGGADQYPMVSVLNSHCRGGNLLVEKSNLPETTTLLIAPL